MHKKMNVLVAGAGISGQSACELLSDTGAVVTLYDGNANIDREALEKKLPQVTIITGAADRSMFAGINLCVLSPGIPLDSELVNMARDAKIPIWGEIELAYHCAKGRLIAITGTNGKTTTTSLIGKICADYFKDVYVVGNIGNAYTQKALQMDDDSVTVAEVSSFQLESVESFHPQVSAILNITPDHLNRHGTMENYAAAKFAITRNQTKDDICILNYDDERLRDFSGKCPASVRFFSGRAHLDSGAFMKGNEIILKDGRGEIVICTTGELNILGRHNWENVMAAVLAADSIGVPADSIRTSVKEFKAVEHRIEFVAEKSGVAYYNDSKGTNTDAAIQAIRAMERPTVLIAGGYDKGSEYDGWLKESAPKVKKLVLLGQTAQKIADAAKKAGIRDIVFAKDMADAVNISAAAAVAGDAVLLSPACASWGMFKNFEERGDIFKAEVNRI